MIQESSAQIFKLTTATQKIKDELDRDIEAHNRAESERRQAADELLAVPGEQWTASHDATASRLRTRQLELLTQEIVLRNRFDALIGRIAEDDFPKARDASFAAFEKAQTEVTKRLLSIGYLDGPIPGSYEQQDNITPDMILRHPITHAAHIAWKALNGHDGWLAARNLNLAGIENARQQFETIKRRSTHHLAA